ncbi:MAG: family 10 glycosylhydrolase [Thermofilaceae archaeon]
MSFSLMNGFRRACWVSTEALHSEPEKAVDKIARLGFEEVLPLVATVGGPLYPSSVRAQPPRFRGRDLVGRFIGEARRRGLGVHAWIVSLCYPNPEFEESRRNLYVVNKLGVSCVDRPPYVPHYKWLCPSREEVRENLADLFLEVAERYEVDGLHFDYIRYPDALLPKALRSRYQGVPLEDVVKPEFDYCYCESCRSKYLRERGVDPRDIPFESELYEDWTKWRARQVTETVRYVLGKVKRAYPSMEVSAAVFPTPRIAFSYVRQDWPSWGLDYYHPMIYHKYYGEGVEWIGEAVRECASRGLPISAGIKVDFMDSYEELKRGFELALENGARGITVFAYPMPKPELEEWVEKAFKELQP